jgi:hypothetical protein
LLDKIDGIALIVKSPGGTVSIVKFAEPLFVAAVDWPRPSTAFTHIKYFPSTRPEIFLEVVDKFENV